MPAQSHPIAITVRGLDQLALFEATVTMTLGTETTSGTTDKDGRVILNAGNFTSWSAGDSVSITATKTGKGTVTESLTLIAGPQSLTLTLTDTSDLIYYDNNTNQHVLNFALLTDYAGDKITPSNPLPVTHGEIDLVQNPSHSWVITRSDGQPDSESVTIHGVVYKRTFTYDSKGFILTRSAWVRQ